MKQLLLYMILAFATCNTIYSSQDNQTSYASICKLMTSLISYGSRKIPSEQKLEPCSCQRCKTPYSVARCNLRTHEHNLLKTLLSTVTVNSLVAIVLHYVQDDLYTWIPSTWFNNPQGELHGIDRLALGKDVLFGETNMAFYKDPIWPMAYSNQKYLFNPCLKVSFENNMHMYMYDKNNVFTEHISELSQSFFENGMSHTIKLHDKKSIEKISRCGKYKLLITPDPATQTLAIKTYYKVRHTPRLISSLTYK